MRNWAGQRNRLALGLSERGIPARISQVYSSFNDAETKQHYTFFLATADQVEPPKNSVWVPIDDLPDLTYADTGIHHMMTRFAREAQTGDFALYLGDAKQGEIHSFR